MIGSEYFGTQLRLAVVVVPVAVYFLVLGLLNSRKHPQLISARQDLVLLMAALSPLLLLPALDHFSGSVVGFLGAAVAAVTIWALASGSSGGRWVVYNLTCEQACQAVQRALSALNIPHELRGRRIELPDERGTLEISSFAVLRNVSIRLRGGSSDLSRNLERQLGTVLEGVEAPTSSMAVGLLMVATAMLVAPLATAVHRAPEIVRVLTDLLH